jgi:hypothetical protein
VVGKQDKGMVWQIFVFLSRLISIGVGIYFQNVFVSLILFSVTGVFVYGYLILQIFAFSGLPRTNALDPVVKSWKLTTALLLAVILVKVAIHMPIVTIGIAIIGVFFYFYCFRAEIGLDVVTLRG